MQDILDFHSTSDLGPAVLASIPQDTLLVVLAYALLGGLYLLVVPLALFFWMKQPLDADGQGGDFWFMAWCFCSSRMVVFAPFLNFRLQRPGDN